MNKTKEYLSQIRVLTIRIRQKQQELEALQDNIMSLGGMQDANHIRTDSPDPDPMASKVGKYVDMEAEIKDLISQLIETRHVIIDQIQMLDDARYVEILYARYVTMETFGQIANEMHFATRHVLRLHGRALQVFGKKFGYE